MNKTKLKFSLRPATVDDIAFIFRLRVITMKPIFKDTLGWDDANEYEKAAEELDHTKIVVLDQNEIGVIKVIPESDNLHLHQLQVLPDFQGKGVGVELIRQTIMQSKKTRKPITLLVVKGTPAKTIYERFGFQVTGDHEHFCKMSWPPNTTSDR